MHEIATAALTVVGARRIYATWSRREHANKPRVRASLRQQDLDEIARRDLWDEQSACSRPGDADTSGHDALNFNCGVSKEQLRHRTLACVLSYNLGN